MEWPTRAINDDMQSEKADLENPYAASRHNSPSRHKCWLSPLPLPIVDVTLIESLRWLLTWLIFLQTKESGAWDSTTSSLTKDKTCTSLHKQFVYVENAKICLVHQENIETLKELKTSSTVLVMVKTHTSTSNINMWIQTAATSNIPTWLHSAQNQREWMT